MKIVAVTTSADRAAAAAIPFTMAGMQPVELPCIEIEPVYDDLLEAVRTSALQADLIVVSSRRTLDLLWPDRDLPECAFAAVGRTTARQIRDRGGKVAFTGTEGAMDLADLIVGSVGGKTVIWPHANGADPAPLERVAARASVFAAPTIYTAVPRPPADDEVDIATFASPSAVQGWTMTRSLDATPVAVIGNTTRRAIEELDSKVDVVAPSPTFQALAQAVADFLGVTA